MKIIPPLAYGYNSSRSELFDKRTDPVFDPLGAAEIAANMTVSGLLEPHRAARLIDFNSRDKTYPHFREVVDELIKATWKMPAKIDAKQLAVARVVQSLTVNDLMDLAANADAQPQVRAVATEALRDLQATLKRTLPQPATPPRIIAAIIDNIEKFLSRPDAPRKQTMPLTNPPGDPIGGN